MAHISWQRELLEDKLMRQLHAIQQGNQSGSTFTAKYAGKCAQCDKRFQVGASVRRSNIGGYEHASCPSTEK